MKASDNNPPTEKKFYYADSENQALGPFLLSELRALAESNTILPDTYVIEEGGAAWTTFQSLVSPPPINLPPVPTRPSEVQVAPRRWPAVFCVIAFFPIGLIAMWLSKGFSRNQKLIMTFASIASCAALLVVGGAGVVVVPIVLNSLLFIWWGESLSALWKSALSVLVCVLLLPPVFIPRSESASTATVEGIPRPSFSEWKASETEKKRKSVSSERTSGKATPYKIGKSFRLGDFTYRILAGYSSMQIGSGYSAIDVKPGAVFLQISYQITNESNRTRTVASDDFILRDGKGREFRPASRALTALMMSEERKDYILTELQPGLLNVTMTAFEIPQSALYEDGPLTLVVPEKGIGGSSAEVVLGSKK